MNLILMHRNCADGSAADLLRFAMSDALVRGIVLDGLGDCLSGNAEMDSARCVHGRQILFAVPEEWGIESGEETQECSDSGMVAKLVQYSEDIPLCAELTQREKKDEAQNSWFVVSNGQFATRINTSLLEQVLAGTGADVIAVNIEPDLLSERERVRLTADGKIAGFRRMYSDSAEFGFVPADWPVHLFIRQSVLEQVLTEGALPLSFSTFVETCRLKAVKLRAVNVGGAVIDLEREGGLLSFCGMRLSDGLYRRHSCGDSSSIAADSKIVGKVLLGRNVTVGANAVIVGPAVVGDNVIVEQGAIIDSSIIASGASVSTNQFLQNCVIKDSRRDSCRCGNGERGRAPCTKYDVNQRLHSRSSFRFWPALSYARCFKRIADILAAAAVLILFAPLIPFVAIAIKLTSPGPVFYRDKRQGLHGKEFDCLKFRTMITGAHAIQEKLRKVSQVDGPQFKMEDDPRISTVGRFLRETYIDEIPQFFNVLFGQMSVVGPRPSPAAENTLCPFWRDARLSVRPGITGLWQLYRTRLPMRDFQEWIYYDVDYARKLSLGMDLRVCWGTTKKLLDNFISQF